MRKLGALMRSIMAAMAAITLVPVIEGGRLVWRAVRAVMSGPVAEAPEAAAELAYELGKAPDAPAQPSPAEAWGRGALAHLLGVDDPDSRGLDAAARAYLDSLDAGQVHALTRYADRLIGEHLLGQRILDGLPQPGTPAEHVRADHARLGAVSRQAEALAEQHQHVAGILAFLADEGPDCLPLAA